MYFASQYPVRTVVLGEDINIDNSLDQEHKIEIKATLGGTRDNKNKVLIDFQVDESLLSNLYFDNNDAPILPLPSNYYELASDQIAIAPGDILGGVQVQLTNAFFADPKALENNYAIPLKMTRVHEADSILADKDFIFYAVKFINEWHGNYLRRGKDVVTYTGETNSVDINRHTDYVERDEVNKLTTKSLQEVNFPIIIKDKDGNNINSTLVLTFDNEGHCTISSGTNGASISGTGSFVKKGDKNSWGNKDRDVLYLDYQITNDQFTSNTKDTLVMRDRAVVPEYFTPVMK